MLDSPVGLFCTSDMIRHVVGSQKLFRKGVPKILRRLRS